MSVIQEAVDHLRAAIAKIDARLEANQAERAQLVDARAAILDLIGEPADSPAVPATDRVAAQTRAIGSRHGQVAKTPAARSSSSPTPPASKPPPTGTKDEDATANRILAFLKEHGPCLSPAVIAASRVPRVKACAVLTQLVEAKRVVKTGQRRGARYSVAGQSSPTSAATEGD